jgi:chromosome segregation ATPase
MQLVEATSLDKSKAAMMEVCIDLTTKRKKPDLCHLVETKLPSAVDAEACFLLFQDGNEDRTSVYTFLQRQLSADSTTTKGALQYFGPRTRELVATVGNNILYQTMWGLNGTKAINDVQGNTLFDANLESVLNCDVKSLLVIPVGGVGERWAGAKKTGRDSALQTSKSGFILVVNPGAEASKCESLHGMGLRSVAQVVHKIVCYEQTLCDTATTYETDVNRYISQLQVMKKRTELADLRAKKLLNDKVEDKENFQRQIEEERQKTVQEIRKDQVRKDQWDRMERKLRTNAEALARRHEKDVSSKALEHRRKAKKFEATISELRDQLVALNESYKGKTREIASVKEQYRSELSNCHAEYKKSLLEAEGTMTSVLEEKNELLARVDTLQMKVSEGKRSLDREATKCVSEANRLKTSLQYETKRRIELEEREENLSAKLHQLELNHRHAIEEMGRTFDRKFNDLSHKHGQQQSIAATSSRKAHALQARAEKAEQLLNERRRQETVLIGKLEGHLLDATQELRQKDATIDEMRASLGIDRDARRRIEELVEQQDMELKKMREYRDVSLKLKGELEDRGRERAHAESSLDGMRTELARARKEIVRLKTRLTKMDPVQQSMEIELSTMREKESEWKSEIAVLKAEVESEAREKHDLARHDADREKAMEKERGELTALRLEAHQLRSEMAKLQRGNHELERKQASGAEEKNQLKADYREKEALLQESKRAMEQKLYGMKKAIAKEAFEREKWHDELQTTRQSLHRAHAQLQTVGTERAKREKAAEKELQDTQLMYSDKRRETEALRSSLRDCEDSKNYLSRRVNQLETELQTVMEDAGDLRESKDVQVRELQKVLEDTERRADMFRMKNQELKSVMLNEGSDLLAGRLAHSRAMGEGLPTASPLRRSRVDRVQGQGSPSASLGMNVADLGHDGAGMTASERKFRREAVGTGTPRSSPEKSHIV